MKSKKELLRAIAERQTDALNKARKIIVEIRNECERIDGAAYRTAMETIDKISELQEKIWTDYDNEPEEN
jgi:hypothetical protein